MKSVETNQRFTAGMNAHNDPWDPIHSLIKYGEHKLTSIEFTMTNLCNMRCEHCAVGDILTMKEGERLPLAEIFEFLEQAEHLQTISITGGEPVFLEKTVNEYIIPILKYAKERGLKSQLNSNATLDYSRYERMAPYLDVLHVSFNYRNADDFYEIGFARTARPVSKQTAYRQYEQMVSNIERLSREGMFVSAESMINYRTHRHMDQIHRLIDEMGCGRHEVHPMYPSSFASHLPKLSLEDFRRAVYQLLDARNPEIWMLFGTLPFYHCNEGEEDRKLMRRLREEPNLSMRNDPDGRNRLNVDLFTGDVYVTDFSRHSKLGNVKEKRLDDIFEQWQHSSLNQTINCCCPQAHCCGPNLLVKEMYYDDADFTKRSAIV